MEEDGRWITTKYGARVFIKEKGITTNKYMNEMIRNNAKTIKATNQQYNKYDDDEKEFKQNNPDIVLQERNNIIDEWTTDGGGFHTNSGIMKYMTKDRELYGTHPGWEQGIKDIDNQIKGKTSENITTYRTIQTSVNDLEVGKIVDEKGFIATSITRSKSNSAFNYGDSRSTTIEVQVDKGTRCLYIGDKTGHHKNEHELLFPPEYQIKIISKEKEYDADGDYLRTLIKGKMIKK